jgi:DNA-binding NtrC family response regulator
MADATAPVLLVVGGDTKRLQWLTHHVTSHWPNAQVTTAPAEDPVSLAEFVQERAPDAVILQVDFGDESAAHKGLDYLMQMLRAQPNVYCIVLAENGSEMSAVRAMKSGAKDYLPLARISRDSLLKAVAEANAKRRASRKSRPAIFPRCSSRAANGCGAMSCSRS